MFKNLRGKSELRHPRPAEALVIHKDEPASGGIDLNLGKHFNGRNLDAVFKAYRSNGFERAAHTGSPSEIAETRTEGLTS